MTTDDQTDAKGEMSASRTSIRWIRIIPVALIMYTIAFIDRTNISLALPHISRDLHLDPQQAGTVAGIFFWGYLALQIPGGHLAKHWSAKKFISVPSPLALKTLTLGPLVGSAPGPVMMSARPS